MQTIGLDFEWQIIYIFLYYFIGLSLFFVELTAVQKLLLGDSAGDWGVWVQLEGDKLLCRSLAQVIGEGSSVLGIILRERVVTPFFHFFFFCSFTLLHYERIISLHHTLTFLQTSLKCLYSSVNFIIWVEACWFGLGWWMGPVFSEQSSQWKNKCTLL